MANHTITLDTTSAKLLIRELKHLEEGLEDVKKGRVKKFNNVEQAIKYLHSFVSAHTVYSN